ncbi:hypothetical protein ACFYST_01040 [Kitasatospora sp. NPDC004614]|uniref:hypothetical protein n=1 Tax=unclassified Kitasatospora TaxID=2633591 RepID=UPI0036768992
MTDLQLVPANLLNPAPSTQQDRPDDAILRRLLRTPALDAAPDRTNDRPEGRPAAGHCRFTMHYED